MSVLAANSIALVHVNKISNSKFLSEKTCKICTKINVNWYKTPSIRCTVLNAINILFHLIIFPWRHVIFMRDIHLLRCWSKFNRRSKTFKNLFDEMRDLWLSQNYTLSWSENYTLSCSETESISTFSLQTYFFFYYFSLESFDIKFMVFLSPLSYKLKKIWNLSFRMYTGLKKNGCWYIFRNKNVSIHL